ncbi:unnamed protein product [Rhizophagus irregularis]|nr:unnamed protein product [Rhizophagus irregularis]
MRSLESVLVSGKIRALEERLDDIDNRLDTLFSHSCPSELKKKVKKLERTVNWIGNYIEEQTGLEPGEEVDAPSGAESSDSDSTETFYVTSDEPNISEKKIPKAKCVKIKSGNKKAKPRRNPFRAYKVEMESERHNERIPEGSSKKEESETRSGPKGTSYASSSNNLPSDPEELTKVFEKNLEALENLVKLFKSDVSKMFDISDPNFPGNSINANPEK